MNHKLSCLTLALISSCSLFSNSVLAQQATSSNTQAETEVIKVKGDFRESSIQSSAIAVSVIGAETIERNSANHLEAILSSAANLNYAGGTSRARFFQIRGIGAQSEYDSPTNYPVGLYIDGVDYSAVGSAATLFDIEQVEVFRGPQSSRFGASALAGLIFLQSAQPTEQASGRVKLGVGNYGTQELGVAYSDGLTDTTSFRVSAHQYLSDGFIENTYLERDDTNNRDELTLRGKLRFQPNQDVLWDFNATHIKIDNGYDAFSLDNTRETLSDQPGKDKQTTTGLSSQLKIKLNEQASFESIQTFATSETDYGFDEDWTYVGIAPGWEYSTTDRNQHDKKNYSTEFRFLSEPQGRIFNQSTDWIVGVYWQKTQDEYQRTHTNSDYNLSSDFDNNKQAIFAQLDSQLTEKLSLTTGLRYEHHKMDYQNSNGIDLSPSYNLFGGKISLNYQVSNDLFWYGSINKGYMNGGVNSDGTLPDDARHYDPEYVWNYESGVKYQNAGFTANLAAFYMQRKDIQLKKDFIIYAQDGRVEQFIPYIRNATDGTSQGIELDLSYLISSSIQTYASLGYLKAEFDTYQDESGSETYPAREVSQSPSYTYNLGFNVNLTDNFWWNIEAEGKDEFYFSDDHNLKSKRYNLVNTSFNYQLHDVLIKLWARNLFDQDHYIQGFDFGEYGNDPRKEYAPEPYFQYGAPKQFGITAEYQF
ncbi:TonB-dependent receptor [Catenovulum sp. 2E275]|uniref:TonB-dependent receptor n=1 Tax=Catenovulum sp. 2E275 TaxID=2980497 RepID=UPI0021D20288|nr:TonB-dependent receptor [Catenovulum sp. 2E275]MCU4675007.1 TonB-dependent receptor [Catenovulum sp. 2E275]